jgi:biotin carboxyl carrier protein
MKMEIPVLAEDAGVVEAVLVEKGSSVAEGQVVASVRT